MIGRLVSWLGFAEAVVPGEVLVQPVTRRALVGLDGRDTDQLEFAPQFCGQDHLTVSDQRRCSQGSRRLRAARSRRQLRGSASVGACAISVRGNHSSVESDSCDAVR